MDNDLLGPNFAERYRKSLAATVPVLGRLENYSGLTNLRMTDFSIRSYANTKVVYEAEASPKIHRRLKSALIEAGVLARSRAYTAVQTITPQGQKWIDMHFKDSDLEVCLRVRKAA